MTVTLHNVEVLQEKGYFIYQLSLFLKMKTKNILLSKIPVLSDRFKSRLNNTSDTVTIDVIVCGLGLEEDDTKQSLDREAVADHYKQAIQPIVKYCESNGIEISSELGELGMVCVTLKKPQIYDLALQPYVYMIEENSKTSYILNIPFSE